MTNPPRDLKDRQIGLGTFPFSGVFSPVSQDDAIAIVRAFLDRGGSYIETAPIYPRAVDLRPILALFPRDRYFIGTKCVLYPGSDGTTVSSGARGSLRSQCLAELSRLGVDRLDLLQAHVTPSDVPLEETAAALNALRAEGLTRFVGVSNATGSDLRAYLRGGAIDFVQNRYSVIYRSQTENVAEICRDHGVQFNPYQVIERGQLVSTDPKAGHWREGDLRKSKAEYIGDAYDRVHRWAIDRLADIAGQSGLTLEALCIRWAFSRPEVSLPVIGATKVWQVERNLEAGTQPLPGDVLSAIDTAYAAFTSDIRQHFGVSLQEFRGLP